MKLLAIETSSRQLGVALAEDDRLLSAYELLAEYPHAVELPEAVRRVLSAARLELAAIDAIAVDVGPGSFTGLRIGLAFVKALAFSLKKPVVTVPSLDVLAAQVYACPRLVCPVLDAKQKNVYAAWFRVADGQAARKSEYLLGPPSQVLSPLTEETLFLGDGCAAYREVLTAQLGPKASFASTDWWLPRASTLARLAFHRLQQGGEPDDPATLVPMYLYPRDCQIRSPSRPTSVLPQRA